MRTPRPAMIGLIGALVLSGCAVAAAATLPQPTSNTTTVRNAEVSATFGETPGTAISYEPALVPAGARVAVSARSDDTTASVRLAVRGLQPDRWYGAHVHSAPCGRTGTDAGPTYQHEVDPVQPSVDPRYANPQNEIWLDLRTDGGGAGSAKAAVDWGFTADRRAQSVVIHVGPTATEAGQAGSAGAEVGCVTVAF